MGAWCFVYGRASKDPDEKRISVERQLRTGTDHAEGLWPGVEVRCYSDNDLSAGDEEVVRPAFQRLMADLAGGGCVGGVANRTSRITRQPIEWEILYRLFERAGIDVINTVESGAVKVARGQRLEARILGAVDRHQWEETKNLLVGMHLDLAREGRPSTGVAPYGYQAVKGEDRRIAYVKHDKHALVVNRIADWLIEGRSLSWIARTLNEEGVATARASKRGWVERTVRQVIEKPSVAGYRSHKPDAKEKGFGQLHDARWEPIVEREKWRKALRALGSAMVLDENGRHIHINRSRPPARQKWLLTGGLAICGKCKRPLAVIRDGDGRPAYRCNRVTGGPQACHGISCGPAELVEEIVANKLIGPEGPLDNPDLAKRLYVGDDPERARLYDEIEAAIALMDEAIAKCGTGEWEPRQRDLQLAPATARRNKARAALAALPEPDEDWGSIEEIRQQWESGRMAITKKRALLDRFLVAVEINPGRPGAPRKNETAAERTDARINPIWRF